MPLGPMDLHGDVAHVDLSNADAVPDIVQNHNNPTNLPPDGGCDVLAGSLRNGGDSPTISAFAQFDSSTAASHRPFDFMHSLAPSMDTPRFGQNGIGISGMPDWNLSPVSLSIPAHCCTPPPPTRLARTQSALSSSLRYCHDPYSLSGSQRLSPPTNPLSHAGTPADRGLTAHQLQSFDEDATNPLTFVTVVAAVPKERNENRGRRKGRGGEHARNVKVFADVPPPTTMRYLPPPPPGFDNVTSGILTLEELYPIALRWYERTVAAEGGYTQRTMTSCLVPAIAPMGQQQLIQTERAFLCPRIEHYPNNFWQWLTDAERWWEGAIRPHTGPNMGLQPPPYFFQP